MRGSTLTAMLLAGAVGLGAAQAPSPPPASSPAEWPSPGRDLQGTRFSPLRELSPGNVAGLRVLWSFSTGSLRGHEASPLVIGDRLYLATPHPTAVYAFDLERPGSPPVWRYQAAAGRDPAPALCCDVSTRGLAWHPSGRLLVPLFPGDLVALSADSGKELWRTRNGDPAAGLTMQGAPLVVGDLVIVGVGGGEFGGRGHLTAYDVSSGRRRWRAYSTGRDADVLLGPTANAAYPSHQTRDLGVATWTADSWLRGGGATDGWLTFDPVTGLLFHGTGAPAPLNYDQRRGDAKWTASLFARDAATGVARWALQLTPGDRWGFGAGAESVPMDLDLGGREVRALVHLDANGLAYSIDRLTGRILLAEKYGPANWASRVEASSGIPLPDPRYVPATGRKVEEVCPSLLGMRTLQPAAYSPLTGMVYVPANNLCMDLEPVAAAFEAGRPFVGANARLVAGPGGMRGRFLAWDPGTATIAWEIREPYPVLGGAMATATGLVFYGTLDGWLKAVDAQNGRELWRFRAPSGILSTPITFASADGRQYVAVVAGVGGAAATAFASATAGSTIARLGLPGAFGDLPAVTNPGGVLLVFGL